ncbi:hypothetical protein MKY98_22845 [Paenibacillus sp. FSL M8-0228]|uniref:hypothetical protein n=1 Tax=Paenibacillus sp. FSL M8-0228 TaxID=2921620 RepID=UPI0030FAE882
MSEQETATNHEHQAEKIDYKEMVIRAYAQAIDLAKDPEVKEISVSEPSSNLIILTNFGLIECELDNNSPMHKLLLGVEMNIADRSEFVNETSLITIKNARLKPFSQNEITDLPIFSLFSDQIVGVSAGSINNLR